MQVTSCPFLTSSSARKLPINPVAPVIRDFMQADYYHDLELRDIKQEKQEEIKSLLQALLEGFIKFIELKGLFECTYTL